MTLVELMVALAILGLSAALAFSNIGPWLAQSRASAAESGFWRAVTPTQLLLDELAAHATQSKYQLSIAYGVGDVVIWDNASLLHSATLVDPSHPRTLWRITLKEPAAAGRARQVLAASFHGM